MGQSLFLIVRSQSLFFEMCCIFVRWQTRDGQSLSLTPWNLNFSESLEMTKLSHPGDLIFKKEKKRNGRGYGKDRLFKDGKGIWSVSLQCFATFAKIHQAPRLWGIVIIFGACHDLWLLGLAKLKNMENYELVAWDYSDGDRGPLKERAVPGVYRELTAG